MNSPLEGLALDLLIRSLELLEGVLIARLQLPQRLEVLQRILVLAKRHVCRSSPVISLSERLVEFKRNTGIGYGETMILHLNVAKRAVGVVCRHFRTQVNGLRVHCDGIGKSASLEERIALILLHLGRGLFLILRHGSELQSLARTAIASQVKDTATSETAGQGHGATRPTAHVHSTLGTDI